MKWTDNLLLEGADPDTPLRGQWVLAMYALHLSAGHSIYCKRITAKTIEGYVHAAASFLSLFTGRDFRKDTPSDKTMGHILAPVYRDLHRYESVPDRREPYDLTMHQLARTVAAAADPDSLHASLTDGFEEGLSAGYRLSEWAQPAGNWNVSRPQLNHLVDSPMRTRAIVPNDFRCETKDFRRATGLAILCLDLTSIHKMWVKFRTQKNGQHGEEKLFTRNPTPGGICFVRSAYRRLQRFERLRATDGRLNPSSTPLSVYFDPPSLSVRLVTATDIETFMRRLAAEVYHLHPLKHSSELQRWSAHSIRVGACVALHAMGFSTLDIQWILRWRSTAFIAYLRNVAILATRQHRALDRAASMPHFL